MKKEDEWFMEWSGDYEIDKDTLQDMEIQRFIDEMYHNDDGDELEHGEFYGDDFTY